MAALLKSGQIVSNLFFDDPCLVFALRREAVPFLRLFPPHQRFPGAPCWARFCGPSWLTVLVLQTGVGIEAARRAMRWLLDRPVLGNVPYQPKVVLSVGFCGALREGYQIGDVILASEIVDSKGNGWPVTWPREWPTGEWRPPLHRARLATSPSLVSTLDQKRTLAEQSGAAVVDMESGVLAQLCRQAGIPFGCLRVVSDDWQMPISPSLAGCLRGRGVDPVRLLAAVVRSPRLLVEIWRLARQTRQAARQLGTALGEVLTLTKNEG